MNKNGIYGGEAELATAADNFKICLIVYREEQIYPHRIGSQNETQCSLLFTGNGDSGHFDVLQNQNKIQISKGQPGFTMTMEKGGVSSSRQGDEDSGWSEVSQKKEENKIVRGRPGSMLTSRERGVLRNEQQRKYREKNNIKKVILENNWQSGSKNNSASQGDGSISTEKEHQFLINEWKLRLMKKIKVSTEGIEVDSKCRPVIKST
ncbi:uncharacterized protein [Neodiprion pinetum]|uniref:uncharacterized protein n=1 Tax=Neodiprion pinetum TaxID=441929 RepID=UPI0037241184